MSVVVALKHQGDIYMAADARTTTGTRFDDGIHERRIKLHRIAGTKKCYILICGKVRGAQIWLTIPSLFGKNSDPDFAFMVREVIPLLRASHKAANQEADSNSALFVTPSHIYKYSRNMLFELDHFASEGSGNAFTEHYLNAHYDEDKDPFDLLFNAIALSNSLSIYTGYPIAITSIKDSYVHVFDQEKKETLLNKKSFTIL